MPGTIAPNAGATPSSVSTFAYSETDIAENVASGLDELIELRKSAFVVWIDVCGLADIDLIQRIGREFKLHRLALEDATNIHQRAKVDEFEDHLFIVARMPHDQDHVETEQISIFLGDGYVITFQERAGDCFEPVRQRLREGSGRIRVAGADYLCYALIDAIVDSYFPALESIDGDIERLEDHVLTTPSSSPMEEIHNLRHELLLLRRAVSPHREMVNVLIRNEHQLITDTTRLYLRDCYDHTNQLMDAIETYREFTSDLVNVHMSIANARLNEVIKVLTMIGAVFIPLGFIAGIYGMNFDVTSAPWSMPELRWRYGYPAVLLLMLTTVGGMIYYFWKKGWIGSGRARERRRGRRV